MRWPPVRIAIVLQLRESQRCVLNWSTLHVPQPLVSQHLRKILKAAGVVAGAIGPRKCYYDLRTTSRIVLDAVAHAGEDANHECSRVSRSASGRPSTLLRRSTTFVSPKNCDELRRRENIGLTIYRRTAGR